MELMLSKMGSKQKLVVLPKRKVFLSIYSVRIYFQFRTKQTQEKDFSNLTRYQSNLSIIKICGFVSHDVLVKRKKKSLTGELKFKIKDVRYSFSTLRRKLF